MRRDTTDRHLHVLRAIARNTRDADERLARLEGALDRIERHEVFERARSHWRSFAYQILLGTAFAVGTILGLVFMSWLTYAYFRDTEVLREVIDRQMKLRYMDLEELKSGVSEGVGFRDLFHLAPEEAAQSGSETVRDAAGGVR